MKEIDNTSLLHKCYKKQDFDVKIKYYQVPKFLIIAPQYKALGLGEKLVYAVLRDRLELSIINNWIDQNGYIYLRFKQKKLAELLCIDVKTVRKYLKNLESFGLIVRISDGDGLSDRIYITDITKDLDSAYLYEVNKGGENFPKGVGKESSGGDGENFPPNENDSAHSENDKSVNLSDGQTDDNIKISQILSKANIGLYKNQYQEIIRQTVEDIYYATDDFCKKVGLPLTTIRERLQSLDMDTLDLAIRKMSVSIEFGEKIGDTKKYFRKVLWNAITQSKLNNITESELI